MTPAHGASHHHAGHEHSGKDGSCGDKCAAANLEQLLEAEFQSQCEQQEDDAYFGPLLYILRIREAWEEAKVRSYEKSGDYVSKYKGLF